MTMRLQFDRLVEELLPVLHVHFLRQGIKSSMFCSQWFLTLFSYRQVIIQIWLDSTHKFTLSQVSLEYRLPNI